MNEQTSLATMDDGWNDVASDASDRTIRGTLVRFADWKWWVGKEKIPMQDGQQYVALSITSVWIRWQAGKPAKHVFRQAGGKMPTREELGDLDESKWERSPKGDPIDPWANTRYVHLIDPLTAAELTFSTNSGGGRSAVEDLAGQIRRMRYAHPNAVPIVALHAQPMPTRYGPKSKPFLKVIGWRRSGLVEDDEQPRQIEHGSGAAAEPERPTENAYTAAKEGSDVKLRKPALAGAKRDDLDDAIPF